MAIKWIENVPLRTGLFQRGTLPLRPALSTCLVPADALVPAVGSMSNSVHDSRLESIHIVPDRLTEGLRFGYCLIALFKSGLRERPSCASLSDRQATKGGHDGRSDCPARTPGRVTLLEYLRKVGVDPEGDFSQPEYAAPGPAGHRV